MNKEIELKKSAILTSLYSVVENEIYAYENRIEDFPKESRIYQEAKEKLDRPTEELVDLLENSTIEELKEKYIIFNEKKAREFIHSSALLFLEREGYKNESNKD